MRSVFWCVRVSFYGHTWADDKSWVNFGSSRFSLASSFLTALHLAAGPESAVMFCNLLRLLGVGFQFSCSFCVVRQWRRWRGEIDGISCGGGSPATCYDPGLWLSHETPSSHVLYKLCVLAEASGELRRWRSNKRQWLETQVATSSFP